MKLRIYGETQVEQEPEVFLRLAPDNDGVAVVACDAAGNKYPQGRLVKFRSDGKIYLNHAINESLGFDLDDDGELMVTN